MRWHIAVSTRDCSLHLAEVRSECVRWKGGGQGSNCGVGPHLKTAALGWGSSRQGSSAVGKAGYHGSVYTKHAPSCVWCTHTHTHTQVRLPRYTLAVVLHLHLRTDPTPPPTHTSSLFHTHSHSHLSTTPVPLACMRRAAKTE